MHIAFTRTHSVVASHIAGPESDNHCTEPAYPSSQPHYAACVLVIRKSLPPPSDEQAFAQFYRTSPPHLFFIRLIFLTILSLIEITGGSGSEGTIGTPVIR
jgi:hypothetical protein